MKKIFLLFTFFSASSSNFNKSLDWIIVLSGSIIYPFIKSSRKPQTKNKNIDDLQKNTPLYVSKFVENECKRQKIDPASFQVVSSPALIPEGGISIQFKPPKKFFFTKFIVFDQNNLTPQKHQRFSRKNNFISRNRTFEI